MFLDFFFYLRARGLKVSFFEWMTLLKALNLGLEQASFLHFYHLCRSLCVKRESHLDLFDQCFSEFFRDAEVAPDFMKQLEEWLQDPIAQKILSDEEMARFESLDPEEMRRLFEERLKEQNERHDGGSHWIGTGGTSSFGHSGYHPGGIRVGGEGGGRSASQIAGERRFKNLRHDHVLDIRQIGVALRKLRLLARDGRPDELDLDETIRVTGKNAGEIELVFRPERKNTTHLLLLMDVGGSMTPFTRLCERLFSAAHASSHFKNFKHYYFHNCPYETLYSDIDEGIGRPTLEVLEELDQTWFCFIVGDAAMAPYELTAPNGAIDYSHANTDPGLVWLHRIAERLPRSVWLNPSPEHYWNIRSTRIVRGVFKMQPLTLEGLSDAIEDLKSVSL